MIFKCLILSLIASAAWGRTTSSNINEVVPQDESRSAETPSSYLSDFRYVFKVYQECSATEFSSCLKLKLVSALDRAVRSYNDVSIIDGVTFVKDPKSKVDPTPKTEAEFEANLPRAASDRDDALNSLIGEKIINFFDTHSLQVKFPETSELAEESRGKKKKLGSLLLIPLLLGGTLVPIALGALALLAGKALIISKLALVLAAIVGLKKLLGQGHESHESGHEVVVGGHGGGGGGSAWGRSYEKEQAQKLAYSAYQPQATQ